MITGCRHVDAGYSDKINILIIQDETRSTRGSSSVEIWIPAEGFYGDLPA